MIPRKTITNGTIILLAIMLFPLTSVCQKIVFTPQWTAQSQFAGYYVALEKGFYKEAGLNVEIQHPSASYSAINRLIEGSSNVISLQLMQAIAEIDKGTELVNILQTSTHNGLVVVSRKDSLQKFSDLKGKKVGIWQVGFGELALMMDKDIKHHLISENRWIQRTVKYLADTWHALLHMPFLV